MTNPTIITDEEYEAARNLIATRDRQRQDELNRKRNALYLLVKPLVESEEFIAIHQEVVALRSEVPQDDRFFGIQLDAVYNGMTGLGIQVANWIPIEDTNTAPPALPTPAEGTSNGE